MEFAYRISTRMTSPNIMVNAMNAESAIAFRGVQHKDFTPRNVICSGNC